MLGEADALALGDADAEAEGLLLELALQPASRAASGASAARNFAYLIRIMNTPGIAGAAGRLGGP